MAISIEKYVSITSGQGGGSAAAERELILRLLSDNELIPCRTVMEFMSAEAVAELFGASIDWLMGNQDGGAVTAKSVAEFITRAVLCGAAKLTPHTVEEDNYCADETYAPGTVRKTTVKYRAAYFPSFWNPHEDVVGEEETRDKVTAAESGGNQTAFWSLNAYLDKLVGFHQLLKSRSMDEEDFQTLIAKHLGRIEE